jgi:glycosyltransferase involved in cell wall biosynthesis
VVGNGFAANCPGAIARGATLARFAAERAPFRLLGVGADDVRSLGLFGESPTSLERRYRPDLVMLHNIDGLIAINALPRFSVPVLWRLHDMWALGGTRHYWSTDEPAPAGLLGRLDRWTWERKARAYAQSRSLHLVPPSHWLAREAAASSLTARLPCTVVPNGVDTETFRPIDRAAARRRLDLADGGLVLAFGAASGAADPRKGFDLLAEALRHADGALSRFRATLLVFGGDRPASIAGLQTRVRSIGKVFDPSRLVDIYNAADLFIAPSRQENLSLMVLESLACGTPVMAFEIGGMPDMIRPNISGWLVPTLDVRLMAAVLEDIADTPGKAEALRENARSLAESEFSSEAEAKSMLALFQKFLLQ